jgi:hypothetical protein
VVVIVRPLNSVVRLHVETPTLKLTPEARSELLAWLDRITEYRAIAAVGGVKSASRMRLLPNGEEEFENIGPHWSVGFYSPDKVPAEQVVRIDDIPFVFGQGNISMRLDGAVLDFRNGQFEVTERAI